MLLGNSANTFLASLPDKCQRGIHPHLHDVELPVGTVLCEAGQEVANVYFPFSGLISAVIPLSDGSQIEAGVVGRTGLVGGDASLNGTKALNQTRVQMAGAGFVITTERYKKLLSAFPALREATARHEQFMHVQAQQAAACNAVHTIEERMCRWLLTISHIVQSDSLYLTQEFIAQMLGVTRTSVTLVAHKLKESGLISYTRGRVTLEARDAIEDEACECFHSIKEYHDRLLLSQT
jgi:CRP-like cAMP-binding protein